MALKVGLLKLIGCNRNEYMYTMQLRKIVLVLLQASTLWTFHVLFLMIHVYYTVHEKSFMCIVFFFVKALKGQCENHVREPVALLMLEQLDGNG